MVIVDQHDFDLDDLDQLQAEIDGLGAASSSDKPQASSATSNTTSSYYHANNISVSQSNSSYNGGAAVNAFGNNAYNAIPQTGSFPPPNAFSPPSAAFPASNSYQPVAQQQQQQQQQQSGGSFQPMPPLGSRPENTNPFGAHRRVKSPVPNVDDELADLLAQCCSSTKNDFASSAQKSSSVVKPIATNASSFGSGSHAGSAGSVLGEPCGYSPQLGLRQAGAGRFPCRRCNRTVICLKCDREVVYISDFVWNADVDYIFFRTAHPCVDKLKSQARPEPGSACYACHCSWLTQQEYETNLVDALDINPKLRWKCR